MKISQLKDVIAAQAKLAKAGVPSCDRLNIYIQGAPGIGKSESVSQVAQTLGIGFVDCRGTMLESVDLRGLPYVEHKDGKAVAKFADPGFLPHASEHGEFGILMFDELAQSPVSVQNPMLQIMKDDCLGEYILPKGWIKVAASNRDIDRAGAGRITTALGNRVVWVDLDVDHEEWIAHELTKGVRAEVIGFIRKLPQKLHSFDAKANVNATPRSWHFASTIITQDHHPDIEHELMEGAVGKGMAAEFSSFRRIWRELPDIGAILKGKDVPCPAQPDIQLVTTIALGCALDLNTFRHAITWMEKQMAPEFATMMVKDSMARLPKLPMAQGFAEWTITSGQKIMAA